MIYLCLFTVIVVGVLVVDHLITTAILNAVTDSVVAQLQTIIQKEENNEVTPQS